MNDIYNNNQYIKLLNDIKQRITVARNTASSYVNRELILLYWDIGESIVERQKTEKWGKSIVEQLSKDIQKDFNGITGYSSDNLWKMRQFYLEYSNPEFLQQLVGEVKSLLEKTKLPKTIKNEVNIILAQPVRVLEKQDKNDLNQILLQPVTELQKAGKMDNKQKLAQPVPVLEKPDETDDKPILPQPVGELSLEEKIELIKCLVSRIPWGQNRLIIQKTKDITARLYYILATSSFGWSRAILLNQIKSKCYERSLVEDKINNFDIALPENLAVQASEAMKSSYNLEFLGIKKLLKEKELEAKLIDKIKDFILELGYGFCFIGSQYKLILKNKEYFIDLLFYHRFLKSLVAVELKVTEFKPEYAGKMDFYLNLLNATEKADDDNPAIGIIICAEQDEFEVEFSLMSKNNPIGVAEYQLHNTLPKELKGKLPTSNEILQLIKHLNKETKI